ncbi:methylenetetrahydrofolate reductase-domain-containing protein [Spinellus fusiger]|nr:methylenetetrahydrofolate reductase-domain-containing protein [Spinellus fusiger]
MKITQKLQTAQKHKRISYSFEYFPPKTVQGLANLLDRIDRMAPLDPLFVSCTWGAGGSTEERTLEICSTAQTMNGLETLMHLTCTNMEREKIDEALQSAKKAGIQNILALRGDVPRDQEYWTPCNNGFSHAVDLVKYIRERHGDYFCIGVAGYPEGHVDSHSKAEDMIYLKEKVNAGADFILTQLFYDASQFAQWASDCREAGIHVPIIPGIMPIPTYQIFRRMMNLCRMKVPSSILNALEEVKSDDQKVRALGIQLVVDIITELYTYHNITAFHLSTLNLERSTRLVLQQLELVPQDKPTISGLLDPRMYWGGATEAALAEQWDEFPNGRYGDARSPAFGENTFGQGHKQPTSDAVEKWGTPETPKDITALFIRYILGQLSSLPWCEEAIETETATIQQRLTDINHRGYWTVSSQPAINGVPSDDSVHGWGPKGGYVYQKAFIEFFVSHQQVYALLDHLSKDPNITYYAMNRSGQLLSNETDSEAQHAVTWGVFPGKEIVQPTLIERANFEAWKVDGLEE